MLVINQIWSGIGDVSPYGMRNCSINLEGVIDPLAAYIHQRYSFQYESVSHPHLWPQQSLRCKLYVLAIGVRRQCFLFHFVHPAKVLTRKTAMVVTESNRKSCFRNPTTRSSSVLSAIDSLIEDRYGAINARKIT